MKNKTMRILFAILISHVILLSGSFAEPNESTDFEVSHLIELKKTSSGGITSFIFKVNGITFYRFICKDKIIIQRNFFAKQGTDSDLRITEYDINVDGSLDAIQIGKDDSDFSPFMVTTKNGEIDITPLPKNWISGSKFPFDAFMNYVKAQKGIEP